MKERSGCLSRQKNFILYFLIYVLCAGHVLGQSHPVAVGADSWGIANANVAGSDPYAVFNNIAGLGGNEAVRLLSSYDSHYGFEGVNTMSFAVVSPISSDLSSGVSVRRFGDKLYNEMALGIGAGHRIGRFSLGLKLNYLQNAVSASSALSRKAIVVEFGGIAKLSEHFLFGAHLYNLTQSSYFGPYNARLPTQLRAGFLFLPARVLRFSGEVEKDTDLPVAVKAGLAYQLWKQLWLRTGVSTQPVKNHFGVGFTGGKFTIDYAVHSHIQLGWSHHFSLSYAILKNKDKAR